MLRMLPILILLAKYHIWRDWALNLDREPQHQFGRCSLLDISSTVINDFLAAWGFYC